MGTGGAEPEAEPLLWRVLPSEAVRTVLAAGWGLRVTGLEHLPRSGPLIVAGNHTSLLDGPLLGIAARGVRYVHFLGKAELFRVPVLGWYLKKAGCIPIERGRGDIGAIRSALEVLRGGGCMGMFPEGHRSKTGLPGPAKAGVGFLAAQTGALAVPARLVGTASFPRSGLLEVRFGPGLRFSGDAGDDAQCLGFSQRVLERVFSL